MANVASFVMHTTDVANFEDLVKTPDLEWITARGGTLLLFGEPGVNSEFPLLFLGASFAIYLPPILFFTQHALYTLNHASKITISTRTQQVTRTLFHVMWTQWNGAMIFFIAPLCTLLIAGVVDVRAILPDWQYALLRFISVVNIRTYGGTGKSGLSPIIQRTTGEYVGLLVFEAIFGLVVALSNVLNDFYIILANLIVCTSLKAFVELASIVPYYAMQASEIMAIDGYFTKPYEHIVFNVSVFADYGVLFFSMLIAFNRLLIVLSTSSRSSYRYACALLVFIVYIIIFFIIRHQRKAVRTFHRNSNATNAEMQLLKHSVLIFTLYAASILCIYLISYMEPGEIIGHSDIAYVENLLNLSIAAAYPICILAMSGEMRSILITRLVPRAYWLPSSGSSTAANRVAARS